MSAADVDLITQMIESFDRGELEGAVESLHPDVELHQPEALIDAQSYFGVAEFLRGLGGWLNEWEQMRYEIAETVDGPRGVFLRVVTRGTGRSSRLEIERRWFHVWRVRDGLAISCHIYADEGPAREEAGLPPQ